MNALLIILSLVLASITPSSFAQNSERAKAKSHEIVGRFVKPNPKLGLPYKHYFVFSNSKGQKMAFPLINESSMDLNKVDYDQTYHINVIDSMKTIQIGEAKQRVKVLKIVEGKVFSMKDLGLAGKDLPLQPTPNIPKENSPHHPMFRINDNVANAAIFTAGAILLSSMLLVK